MSYEIGPSLPNGWEVRRRTGSNTLEVFVRTKEENHAFMIAAALNMMDAREQKRTPWEVLSSVQAGIIGVMETIADDILAANPLDLLNRQCKYCGTSKSKGLVVVDGMLQKVEPNGVHKPTCLISVLGEWKVLAADRINEAIRRSKAK